MCVRGEVSKERKRERQRGQKGQKENDGLENEGCQKTEERGVCVCVCVRLSRKGRPRTENGGKASRNQGEGRGRTDYSIHSLKLADQNRQSPPAPRPPFSLSLPFPIVCLHLSFAPLPPFPAAGLHQTLPRNHKINNSFSKGMGGMGGHGFNPSRNDSLNLQS